MKDGEAELLEREADVLAKRPPVSLLSRDSATSFGTVGSLCVEVDGVNGMPAGRDRREEREREGTVRGELDLFPSVSLVERPPLLLSDKQNKQRHSQLVGRDVLYCLNARILLEPGVVFVLGHGAHHRRELQGRKMRGRW